MIFISQIWLVCLNSSFDAPVSKKLFETIFECFAGQVYFLEKI